MAIGKGKRQNFGLETLADEDRAVPIEVCHDSIPSRLVIAIVALPVARSTAANCDTNRLTPAAMRASDHETRVILSLDHNQRVKMLWRVQCVDAKPAYAIPLMH
jgi:hypothetical protein